MATSKKAPAKLDPDNKGYIYLKKGDTVFRCVPESAEVWLEDGWSVVDHEKVDDVPKANDLNNLPADES